jgi:hypothetical protein
MRKLFPPALVLTLVAGAAQAGEVKSFPGHGSVAVEKSTFSQAKENQKGLDHAERLAVIDAVGIALRTMMGAQALAPGQAEGMVKDLADHGSTFIKDRIIKESNVDGSTATVDLVLKVDFAAMREYLETKGVSLTQSFEQKFKCFVLSYTVEGMDPDRSKPMVLHEEVRDERTNVHASAVDASESDSASHSHDRALKASRDTDYSSANLHAKDKTSESASHDASVSAREYSDTSSSYYRVTDYADPTKKGAAGSNDVRAKLEGALNNAGITVALLNLPLGGKDFQSEDAFIDEVLTAVARRAEVKANDYVALAINSLTPVNGHSHQFTSKVTFRVVRVHDKVNLISADSVAKTSERKPSDDEARLQATNLALMTLDATLPEQIRKGLQKLNRAAAATSPFSSGTYVIEIQDVRERSIIAKTKTYLKQEGFKFTSETGAGGTLETLTLQMGNRSLEDIKDVLDGLPDALALLSKDDSGAKLRVK